MVSKNYYYIIRGCYGWQNEWCDWWSAEKTWRRIWGQKEDVLSDNLYYYNAVNDAVSIVE